MNLMAYKMRRLGGRVEVYHLAHGWVEAVNIRPDTVKIKRYCAQDGGFVTHNESHENFKLTGEV
tara:strand:- start:36 stop:227 length:192 start_codon:yes stop_codon:yes gene_type:complete